MSTREKKLREAAIQARLEGEVGQGLPQVDGSAPVRQSLLIGLIGAGIEASRTPAMHEREADEQGLRCIYKLIDLDRLGLEASALEDLVVAAERLGFDGLNITHPCKQAAVALLDELSPDAQAIGAVNTIVFRHSRRIGHNTDCSGFLKSFQRELPDVRRERVILLGAGGAGAAVARALMKLGTGWIGIFDVDGTKAKELAGRLKAEYGTGRAAALDTIRSASREADGLVNTTPMGMTKYPGMPISANLLHPDLWLADIIYFPMQTDLLQRARDLGCRTMNGVGMAVFQAADAFRIFTGSEPNVARMRAHFEALSSVPLR